MIGYLRMYNGIILDENPCNTLNSDNLVSSLRKCLNIDGVTCKAV